MILCNAATPIWWICLGTYRASIFQKFTASITRRCISAVSGRRIRSTLLLIDGIEKMTHGQTLLMSQNNIRFPTSARWRWFMGNLYHIWPKRAFVGAINIITKNHRDMVKAMNGKKQWLVWSQVGCKSVLAGAINQRRGCDAELK